MSLVMVMIDVVDIIIIITGKESMVKGEDEPAEEESYTYMMTTRSLGRPSMEILFLLRLHRRRRRHRR
jgi:hypothetical protein